MKFKNSKRIDMLEARVTALESVPRIKKPDDQDSLCTLFLLLVLVWALMVSLAPRNKDHLKTSVDCAAITTDIVTIGLQTMSIGTRASSEPHMEFYPDYAQFVIPVPLCDEFRKVCGVWNNDIEQALFKESPELEKLLSLDNVVISHPWSGDLTYKFRFKRS
jgi:hypothetical protein